jgi:hypothetical protein
MGAVCLCAVLAVVVIELARPATYTSEALLFISKQRVPILKAPDHWDLNEESFIENQFGILRSSRLLEQLASDPHIAETPELAGEQDVAAAIGRRIKTEQRGKSDIYTISFTSVSPEHAQAVLQGVVNTYLSYYSTAETDRYLQQIDLLKKLETDRHREITMLRQELRERALSATGFDPFQPDPDRSLDFDRDLLKELQKELVQQVVQQELLAANIAAETQQEAGPSSAENAASSDKLQAAKSEHAAGEARVKALEKKIKSIRVSQKQYTGETSELEFTRSKLSQVTAIHDKINARILELSTEQVAAPRVSLLSQASRPRAPDRRWWEVYR